MYAQSRHTYTMTTHTHTWGLDAHVHHAHAQDSQPTQNRQFFSFWLLLVFSSSCLLCYRPSSLSSLSPSCLPLVCSVVLFLHWLLPVLFSSCLLLIFFVVLLLRCLSYRPLAFLSSSPSSCFPLAVDSASRMWMQRIWSPGMWPRYCSSFAVAASCVGLLLQDRPARPVGWSADSQRLSPAGRFEGLAVSPGSRSCIRTVSLYPLRL